MTLQPTDESASSRTCLGAADGGVDIRLFERPLPPGWVYPCSLQDIRMRLAELPPADVDDLWAVGLAPSTWRDSAANARYLWGEKPVICVYSYPGTLCYRQPPHLDLKDVRRWLWVEVEYGMQVHRQGSRTVCSWDEQNLRHFILDHVLAHEIGHHVFRKQRIRVGLAQDVKRSVSEQFAEAYALRHHRSR